MTRPPELPALPAVRAHRPPRGFEDAVRAAGRRRWRRVGGGLGALAAVTALVLALPAAPGGTTGLHPTGTVPGGPPAGGAAGGAGASRTPAAVVPATVSPATAVPATEPPPAPSPAGPDGTAAPASPDAAPGTESPAGPPAGTPEPSAPPGASPSAKPGPGTPNVPWTRSQSKADVEALARCAGGSNDAADGTRWGDWCLIAGATGSGDAWAFTLAACALTPAAQALVFVDGRELDFALRATDPVWSSATGRTFPEQAPAVKAAYGECTVWTMPWDRRADDGSRVAGGKHGLDVVLRLTGGATPREKHTVLLDG